MLGNAFALMHMSFHDQQRFIRLPIFDTFVENWSFPPVLGPRTLT
jgi:hypothetical protein